jgi:hypothetical protein
MYFAFKKYITLDKMLNIGLKNAILFLLIILILHFLLKNVLVDKKELPNKAYFKAEKFTEQNYLDALFNQKLIKTCETNTCLPRKSDNNSLPLSTTCDTEIQELKPEDPMKLKADCKIPQDYKSFMVIKEYENEKGINGGKLYDGLIY